MRILHIGKFYPPFAGGIENFMAALLPELAREGLEIAALVHHHEKGQPFLVKQQNASTIYFSPTYGNVLFTPISPKFPFHLSQIMREFNPDILHIHAPNVSAFWVLLMRRWRHIPIVIQWQSDVVASEFNRALALAYSFYRPLERLLLSRSTAIIAASPPYLNSSPALTPWREKCRMIPLGLTSSTTPSAVLGVNNVSYWQESCKLKVLCVGRLTYYKGHEYLIRAAAELSDVEIVVVGKGNRKEKLCELISVLGVEEKVTLFGPASESQLKALMINCDVLCLPSIERTEAFGIVLLEAMREGKTTVTTDVPGSGISWVVQNGVTGLVCRAADVGDLRDALSRLRDDPIFRQRLGNAGKERFQANFTIERVARQIADLYRSILFRPN